MRWSCPEIPIILWTLWAEVFPPLLSLPITWNDFGSNNTAPNKTWLEDSARLDDPSQSLDLWEVLLDLGILRTAQQIWNVDAEHGDWAEGHQHSKVNPGWEFLRLGFTRPRQKSWRQTEDRDIWQLLFSRGSNKLLDLKPDLLQWLLYIGFFALQDSGFSSGFFFLPSEKHLLYLKINTNKETSHAALIREFARLSWSYPFFFPWNIKQENSRKIDTNHFRGQVVSHRKIYKLNKDKPLNQNIPEYLQWPGNHRLLKCGNNHGNKLCFIRAPGNPRTRGWDHALKDHLLNWSGMGRTFSLSINAAG